jgi:hypothetical protein
MGAFGAVDGLSTVAEPTLVPRRSESAVTPSTRAARFLGLTLLVALVACTHQAQPSRHSAGTPHPTPSLSQTQTPTGQCRVIQPNGATPPGEAPSDLNHGNGKLWTVLWPHGVVIASGPDQVRPDGSIGMKFPWWRGVRGRLRIEGHRLDGIAPPLRTEMSDYGPTGFQASGLIFPTPGCWEVTGQAGPASLTFVTLVVAR